MASAVNFAALLRSYRHAANLTLEALGERSGVSARAISDMERGRSRGPQARTVEALADALGLGEQARGGFSRAAGRGRARGSGGRAALPALDEGFVGRAVERRRLTEAVLAAGGARPVVVSGPGGIGKSALAVRAARDVVDRFDGGPDVVALGGQTGAPLAPAAVAAHLLVAHGTSASDVPRTAGARFAALADLLAARRGLLVLDDAHDEAQVRPLLRHHGGTAVVVTSRRALGGLDAAARFPLEPLAAADAETLLAQVLGDPRTASHRGLAELAAVCGRFPLALRIVANRLLSRPGWTVQTMLDRLADESLRLGRMRAGDVEVQSAFAVSYEQLRPVEQRVFRRMAVVDGRTWGAGSAAVLAELAEDRVDGVLDDLVELGLVTATADGRYAFHDLLRLFATDRLGRDDGAAVTERIRTRHHNWLLATATDAGRWFEPTRADGLSPPTRAVVGDRDRAERWLQAEGANWFAALQAAAVGGADHTVVDVADAMHWYSDRVPFWSHWHEVFDLARQAAHRLGDDVAEATHTNYLAWVETMSRHDPEAALVLARHAAELARRAGDTVQLAWGEAYGAWAWARLGESELALAANERAAEAFDRAGDRIGALQARNGAADSARVLGRYDDAVRRAGAVVERVDALAGDLPPSIATYTRAMASSITARAYADAGRLDEAEAAFGSALADWDHGGFGVQRARTTLSHARLLVRTGDPGRAREVARGARAAAVDHDDLGTAAEADAFLADLGAPRPVADAPAARPT